MMKDKDCLLDQLSEDAAFVRNEVERIMALLRAADAKEESEDTEVKEWLFQIQDVAYDAQDILDKLKQITYEANQNNRFLAKLLKRSTSRKDSAVEVEDIASELKTVQERIKNVFGIQKYQSIYANLEQDLGMNPLNDSQGDKCIQEEIDFVGFEIPRQELISWIMSSDPEKKVMSVIGKAGVGKTSLVKKIFDDKNVIEDFNFHLYVTPRKACKGFDILFPILEGIFGETQPEDYEKLLLLSMGDWIELINNSLQEMKYIFCVDEFVEKTVWDVIQYAFPENQKGSRVLFITSSHELPTGSSVFHVRPLSQEDSWILFCKKAFSNHSCPPHLMEISRSITNQLDGVPLALHMIGGALCKKNTIEEWEMFYHKLVVALEKSDKSEAIREIISIAYRDLPLYLKPCFLYLNIFPQFRVIEKTKLLRLWAAEGLLKLKEGETGDEVGENYINELVNRSLVQIKTKFVDGRLAVCSIQHLVHDFLLLKGRERTIVSTDQIWPNKARRLVLHSYIINNQTGTSFEHLHSFVNIGYTGSLSKSFLDDLLYSGKKHMLLKVVDLEGFELNKIPEGIFNMYHLEYLNLSHTNISNVPKSIGELHNLHFLNLKHTPVKKLPNEILKLRQLEHLLVNRREDGIIVGCEVPRNIGTLVSLTKLSDVEANDAEFVKGIANLTQLTMLAISKLRRKDGMNLCLSLKNLTNLRILNINAVHGDEVIDLQHLTSLLPFLRTLTIAGRMEKLPIWIASHHSLATMQLHMCGFRETPLGTVEYLPNLCELLLNGAYNGKELLFKACTFPRLKRLNLKNLNNLRNITIEEGSMPLLEELYIIHTNLSEVPCGIEHLAKLKVLKLEYNNSRLARPDGRNVSHIPKVIFNI